MYKILATKKGGLLYLPNFYSEDQANYILDHLKIFQNPEKIHQKVKGKLFPMPRKVLYYGEKDYSYSGITHVATGKLPSDFRKILENMKNDGRVTKLIKAKNIDSLNSVLINYYDNENNYLSWHSDDEPELGPDNEKNILIVSLSLGSSRTLCLKGKGLGLKSQIELQNGDLVVMYGDFQHNFEHSVPKAKCKKDLRINLTYRMIL